MKKVTIVVEVEDQPRLRELVAMWAHGLVGTPQPVHHPMTKADDTKSRPIADLLIVDFVSAEVMEEPQEARRMTKLDLQEKLGVSGDRDE